jgi:hypothetical protein
MGLASPGSASVYLLLTQPFQRFCGSATFLVIPKKAWTGSWDKKVRDVNYQRLHNCPTSPSVKRLCFLLRPHAAKSGSCPNSTGPASFHTAQRAVCKIWDHSEICCAPTPHVPSSMCHLVAPHHGQKVTRAVSSQVPKLILCRPEQDEFVAWSE